MTAEPKFLKAAGYDRFPLLIELALLDTKRPIAFRLAVATSMKKHNQFRHIHHQHPNYPYSPQLLYLYVLVNRTLIHPYPHPHPLILTRLTYLYILVNTPLYACVCI